jgi:hypothetical protein
LWEAVTVYDQKIQLMFTGPIPCETLSENDAAEIDALGDFSC